MQYFFIKSFPELHRETRRANRERRVLFRKRRFVYAKRLFLGSKLFKLDEVNYEHAVLSTRNTYFLETPNAAQTQLLIFLLPAVPSRAEPSR